MKEMSNLFRYKVQKLAATIGIFDGVHKGHQRILKKLAREAKKEKLKSVVITFNPHPQKVLNPKAKIPFLMSLEHRIKLIKEMGIDSCRVIKFTKSFSRIAPEDFIKNILIGKRHLKVLIVGENFLFGFKEKGDANLLKSMSKRYNFKLYTVAPLKMKGKIVSSTRIREAIENGNLRLAGLMLGRPVTILGTVIKGKGIGRKIGFPTANINPHHESIPPSAVYAVDVRINKKLHKGILNIGTRPTFTKDKDPAIEIHIFNFRENIYGKDLEIIFKRKLRNEKKFSSPEALKRQIKSDILTAKSL